jgi:hypothetical protein
MVMPGCPCTNDSACAARVPLPLRRPARRFVGAAAVPEAAAVAGAALVVLPAGRPTFLPFGRPTFLGRPGGRPRFLAGAVAAAFLPDPGGRPGPRRRGAAAVAVDPPPIPSSAEAAASNRRYSSTSGPNSASRPVISRRFSSRKSVTIQSSFTRANVSVSHSVRVTLHHSPAKTCVENYLSRLLGTLDNGRESVDSLVTPTERAAARAYARPLAWEFRRPGLC